MAMGGINLSEWALTRRSITIFLMIIAVGAGLHVLHETRAQRGSVVRHQDDGRARSLARRNRRRDDEAGHRAARTHAAGDAAARLPSQLHAGGRHDDLRQSEGQRHREGSARHLVPRPQEHRRHADDAYHGAWPARSSTTSSATPSEPSSDSPRTVSPIASFATMSRRFARKLLHVPDVSKIEILGDAGRAYLC